MALAALSIIVHSRCCGRKQGYCHLLDHVRKRTHTNPATHFIKKRKCIMHLATIVTFWSVNQNEWFHRHRFLDTEQVILTVCATPTHDRAWAIARQCQRRVGTCESHCWSNKRGLSGPRPGNMFWGGRGENESVPVYHNVFRFWFGHNFKNKMNTKWVSNLPEYMCCFPIRAWWLNARFLKVSGIPKLSGSPKRGPTINNKWCKVIIWGQQSHFQKQTNTYRNL